jgi:hypothetical protein
VQLKLVRSGGLAGLDMVTTIDTTDLPVVQQSLAAALLTADPDVPGVNRPGGADQFSYRLEVRDGDHTVHHRWAEPEVPEVMRPLLAELARRAKPAH